MTSSLGNNKDMGENGLSSFEILVSGEELILDDEVGITPLKATTLASNIAGSCIFSGSSDGALRCIDFSRWESGGFGPLWSKTLEQSVASVAVSNDDSVIAVASGNMLHFYTDGGDFVVNSTKGDMYLVDARKTKGHTSAVTCVSGDPYLSNIFASGSLDGTVRLFDLESGREGVSLSVNSKQIYLPKTNKGGRIPIHSICYAQSAGKSQIIGGTDKGGLFTWDCRTSQCTSTLDAHASLISCILASDDAKLVTRSYDSVKLWDIRSMKRSVEEITVEGDNTNQSIALSPDNKHLAVTEVLPINPKNLREGFKGGVQIFNVGDFTRVENKRLKSPPGPIAWAHDTGQLFSICLDGKIWARCGSNVCGAMYASRAKATVTKRNQYSSVTNVSAKLESYAIDDLPDDLVECDDGILRRKRTRKVFDKTGSNRGQTEDPLKLGQTPISYEDEDIVAKLRTMQSESDNIDKSAEKSGIQKIPYNADKFMAMYKKTQPNLILDFAKPETVEENMLLGVRKCPRCGIKICQCGYMDMKK
ncbi:WD domain, G-beta repeat domain-containing protein [Theileria equi strain WA]|uniref:WD domain, G-beta repeat domain-containing protein n=1 Tax=Theileria equi strain WA TaxID=1537102 RepID=L0B1S9_THEEQ|nr:WD domain, G-beta repeat domain-containing protein [Theileria equi strain WA]AFZ81206.1 WD domain, G-beta repeat domain-containing protein [Theileria equi strain WA]|eukprot:XP_004830872.1 WD domain, G-beta repeat domain-containing protein [Theileria equi strain WA]